MDGCRSSTLSSSFAIVALFSLLVITTNVHSCAAGDPQKNSKEFIKVSCQVTRYPLVCFKSLAVYANTIKTSPIQLAHAALSVTLASLQSTSVTMSRILARQVLRPREVSAMKDCVENISDSVDELKRSLVEIDRLEGPEFEFHMSNLQTWVSAAMTGEDTCTDGFSGYSMNGSIKSVVMSRMVNATKLTSNALALIASLDSKRAASPLSLSLVQ